MGKGQGTSSNQLMGSLDVNEFFSNCELTRLKSHFQCFRMSWIGWSICPVNARPCVISKSRCSARLGANLSHSDNLFRLASQPLANDPEYYSFPLIPHDLDDLARVLWVIIWKSYHTRLTSLKEEPAQDPSSQSPRGRLVLISSHLFTLFKPIQSSQITHAIH